LEYRNLEDELRQKSVSVIIRKDSENWVLEDKAASSLLEKIKTSGIPLGQYVSGKIFYGIKTGYNKAFIIDKAKRQELIEKDPKSEEIIKPYLTGKEIKRYSIEWKGKYLIFAKHGIRISDYPEAEKHLLRFKENLTPKKNSDDKKGRKPGKYKWYEIQDSIEYYQEFEKPKVVWGNLSRLASFAYDMSSFYVNAPGCIMTTEETWLLHILNSRIADYLIRKQAIQRRGGFIEQKPMYVAQIPIPKVSENNKEHICELANAILAVSSESKARYQLEAQLNELIYQLYGLTNKETEIIEIAESGGISYG